MDEKESCPVCKSDKYLNPNLKLLVSPCFHRMFVINHCRCQTCIDRLFTAGPAPCPLCKYTLRKSNFVVQTFEDLLVEKEIQIRKKFGKYFNKRIDNFNGDLQQYNDYLEQVEDILFNLIHDVDVEKTLERIEEFRRENKDIIAANLAKQMNEEKIIAYKLEKERKERILRKEAYMLHLQEEERQKKAFQEEIIQKLATSDASASDIIKEFKMNDSSGAFEIPGLSYIIDEFDQGMMVDDVIDSSFDPMDHIYEDPTLYTLQEQYHDPLVLINNSWTAQLQTHKGARGGGYQPYFTYQRALSSAFSGLFVNV